MQVYGLDKGQSGNILSMLAVGMTLGSPLLSYLSNAVFQGRKPVLIISSFIVLGITALLAFFTDSIPIPALYGLCFLIGIFASAIVVIGFTANKELFPVQIAGTATGLINLFPFAGGAIFQPLLGYVLESHGKVNGVFTLTGYRQVMLIFFFCALIALVSCFFVQETLYEKEPAPKVQ